VTVLGGRDYGHLHPSLLPKCQYDRRHLDRFRPRPDDAENFDLVLHAIQVM
jgi:hypothetical protein